MVDHNVISSHHVTRKASLSSKGPVELSAAVRNLQLEQKRIRPSNHKTQVDYPYLLVQHTHTHTHTHTHRARTRQTLVYPVTTHAAVAHKWLSRTDPVDQWQIARNILRRWKQTIPLLVYVNSPSVHAKQGRIFQTVSSNNSGNTFKLNTKTFCWYTPKKTNFLTSFSNTQCTFYWHCNDRCYGVSTCEPNVQNDVLPASWTGS